MSRYQGVRSFERSLHLSLLLAGLPSGGPVSFRVTKHGQLKKWNRSRRWCDGGRSRRCGRRGNWVPVAVLRCNQIIRPDRQCSNDTKAKRQSPVRGSAVYRHVGGFIFYCLFFEALPSIMPSDFTGGYRCPWRCIC
jgi:hypothetical protein